MEEFKKRVSETDKELEKLLGEISKGFKEIRRRILMLSASSFLVLLFKEKVAVF